ncbi:MAG: hypothetical protein K5866_08320 [Treponema sp.]|nr:hypothetical protein [Treponema sp.]
MRRSSLILLILPLFLSLFLSCSQTTPEMRAGYAALLFNYFEDDSQPLVRLSYFGQTETNPQRIQEIEVKSLSSNLSWYLTDLIKIQENKKFYVGSNNMAMPANEAFPKGLYQVTFTTFDEETYSMNFNLNYDSSLYDLKNEELESYVSKKSFRKNVAAFDDNDVLLFSSDLEKGDSSFEQLLFDNPEAVYYKDVYISSNKSVYLIFPQKLIESK